MENDPILAKQTDLLINIIFNFEACCFCLIKHSWWNGLCHPFLVVPSSSFRSHLIKYHPPRIEPSTAILCQGTLLVSCAVLLTINHFLIVIN